MLKLKRILVKEGILCTVLILSLMVVVCVLLIIVVAMQPSKTNAANLTGGAEQLFGKQKARGFEAFLIRVTVVLGTIFMLLAFALAYISSK